MTLLPLFAAAKRFARDESGLRSAAGASSAI